MDGKGIQFVEETPFYYPTVYKIKVINIRYIFSSFLHSLFAILGVLSVMGFLKKFYTIFYPMTGDIREKNQKIRQFSSRKMKGVQYGYGTQENGKL